jgi:hypothetical protein
MAAAADAAFLQTQRVAAAARDNSRMARVLAGAAAAPTAKEWLAKTAGDPLEALARLQASDGCFSLAVLSAINIALKSNSDVNAVRAAFPAGACDRAPVDEDGRARARLVGGHLRKGAVYQAALLNTGAAETVEGIEAKAVPLLA